MTDVLIALVILMLGIVIGSVIALVVIFAVRMRELVTIEKSKSYDVERENEELKAEVEELKASYKALLEETTSDEKHYENAFEFTDAVLSGKEDFR